MLEPQVLPLAQGWRSGEAATPRRPLPQHAQEQLPSHSHLAAGHRAGEARGPGARRPEGPLGGVLRAGPSARALAPQQGPPHVSPRAPLRLLQLPRGVRLPPRLSSQRLHRAQAQRAVAAAAPQQPLLPPAQALLSPHHHLTAKCRVMKARGSGARRPGGHLGGVLLTGPPSGALASLLRPPSWTGSASPQLTPPQGSVHHPPGQAPQKLPLARAR